jgi:hypothetical protein
MNQRAKSDKTCHLVVSFQAGERPAHPIMKDIEERICTGLGYADHQRISVVHTDTDHWHIHIAINKIHPVRRTIHEPYYSHRTMGDLCERLEQLHGLQRDNHVVRQRRSAGLASDMERQAGMESLIGWIRRECLAEIKAATNWTELHAVLQRNGLHAKARGNGLVFEARDGTIVKASSVDRGLSMAALKEHWGSFIPCASDDENPRPVRDYQKRPLTKGRDTSALYERYELERSQQQNRRLAGLTAAKAKRDRELKEAKTRNQLRRAAIRLMDSRGIDKRLLYTQAGQAYRENLSSIHTAYAQVRDGLRAGTQKATWLDWLCFQASRGDREAVEVLRSRAVRKPLQGNTFSGAVRATQGVEHPVQTVTKTGTVVYRVDGGAIRDDGIRLQVTTDATARVCETALDLAIQRFAGRVEVHGSKDFKLSIVSIAAAKRSAVVFTDPTLEQLRLDLLNRKESLHERHSNAPQPRHASPRGLHDRRTAGRPGHVAEPASTRSAKSFPFIDHRGLNRDQCKPNPHGAGRLSQAPGLNGVRTLSQLGVVRFTAGSEVLLPSHASDFVEQRRAQSDLRLRWGNPVETAADAGWLAAEKYIAERTQKQGTIFDIPNHERYTAGIEGLKYAGSRKVDGQTLVLLSKGDQILVYPVPSSAQRSLSRLSVGQPVKVLRNGAVQKAKVISR